MRLHFEGFDLGVNNSLNEIVVEEFGALEEFGLLSIAEATSEALSIPEVGADTTALDIGQVITSVHVVNDAVIVYGDGSLTAKLEYPQAIAFGTDEGVIMLDKEGRFSEMTVIKQGNGSYDD